MKFTILSSLIALLLLISAQAQLVFDGTEGKPGNGKHIVLVAGDEEYRSEESCPMLGKILAKHHGFTCTVLFSVDPATGNVDPNNQNNIPGMDAINAADLVIIGTRFRVLPDDQLKPLYDYMKAGKPIVGFRTATHGFNGGGYGGFNWRGWGVEVLGEGWAGHYGRHKAQGAKGVVNPKHAKHPLMNGVSTFFGESDVYGVKRVTDENATILAHGVVTDTLYADSADSEGKVPQAAVWLRDYQIKDGKKGQALCSTFGSSCDFEDGNLRRIIANAAYHFCGLDVPAAADVSYVDPFEATAYSFARGDYFIKQGLKPADFGWGKSPQTGPKMNTLLKDGPQRRAPFKAAAATPVAAKDNPETLVLKGTKGKAGNGKHIVLISGDEEYRSEESCPMLGKILAKHHGFDCTVLFSQTDGYVDPNNQRNIPGMEAIASADLVIVGTRFRTPPEDQLKPFADYLNAGKPVLGFRTATHGFRGGAKTGGINWGGWGVEVLGEGWVSHWGHHKVEGAKGVVNPDQAKHPVLKDVGTFFGESDVYEVRRVTKDNATVLAHGIVTETLYADSKDNKKKAPQVAVWIRDYKMPEGKAGKALCSTFGSSCDFEDENLRRIFVNATYHFTGLDVPANADVSYVDPFEATAYSFIREKDYFKKLNLKPADFGWGKSPKTGPDMKTLLKDGPQRREALKGAAKPKKAAGLREVAPDNIPTTAAEQQKTGKRPKFSQPLALDAAPVATTLPLKPAEGDNIVFIGNGLAERMGHFGHFESRLQTAFADKGITFRNMGFPGHTPAFRPEAGQPNPWAFPGGDKFRPEIKRHHGKGHYPTPDEWLTILRADIICAFFGFNESFSGEAGIDLYKDELRAFVDHTLSRSYHLERGTPPKLVLVSPTLTNDKEEYSLPDPEPRNKLLAAYAAAMKEVATEKKVGFVDLTTLENGGTDYDTINGVHLSDAGYKALAPTLFAKLFGSDADKGAGSDLLRKAVNDKSWFWRNDYRMLNGVHVYGQRWNPYGNFNYPEEIEKIRQMTVLREENIRKIVAGASDTLKVDDSGTRELSPVTTNYKPSSKNGELTYIQDEEKALSKFILPEGYEVSVFATEQMFPNLGNPVQMQFDNKGRLWVSTVPSYPHYKPGGPMPDDKILIYEDTDGDGRADKETIFARNLHVPIGFEFAPGDPGSDGINVYCSEEPYLVLLKDTDGDDMADVKEYILDGFDPHDTHHGISSFNTDNGGGVFMCEGRFLHSQVETPYGPQRMADGGAWRFDPHSWRVDRFLQTDFSNPWAIEHDEYGQNFINDASGGNQYWMLPLSIKVDHGVEVPKVEKFNYEHHIRPSSGSEFIHSRHFPEGDQGNYIYCNSIGFLGIKQYNVFEDGVAIRSKYKQDLIRSTDGNCRPADLELAPDGSLYFLDWHNTLIGHMQHSARDPNRNSKYGRIYRITYPSRPLVEPPQIAGASIEALFENMKLPELQTRKQSHLELRGHDAKAVIAAAHKFAETNRDHEEAERLTLEALWATWGHNDPSIQLYQACMKASDHRVRAAAVRVMRHNMHLVTYHATHLRDAAVDEHPRVRLEALAAGTWADPKDGAAIALTVASKPTDKWIRNSLNAAMPLLKSEAEKMINHEEFAGIPDREQLLASKLPGAPKRKSVMTKNVNKRDRNLMNSYRLGEQLYHKDGACITCHQPTGLGMQMNGLNIYPPLVDTPWATGDKDRAIKIVLHGMMGKMTVKGKTYDPAKGTPPMTAFAGMYSDAEVAGVLNYVRNSWGNKSDNNVSAADVKRVRAETKDRKIFWNPEELLKQHPLEGGEKQTSATEEPESNAKIKTSGPLVYQGESGFGLGKHIVFIASDHEYRSEETLPALAKILAKHHGFRCTVLFGINEDGHITAGFSNVPHMHALDAADGMVIFTRFLNLPDEQMVPFENYLNRAGPVVGLRTASHGFKIPKDSKWYKYDFRSTVKGYENGFGHQVLGNTWVGHYGKNHKQGNEILLEPKAKNHPILRGVQDRAFTYAGGYNGIAADDFTVLTHTQPLMELKPGAAYDESKPKVPSSWTRHYSGKDNKKGRVFHTTQGASEDILDENYRRLVLNGILWSLGLEKQITSDLNVALVGPYRPNPFSGAGHAKNVTPDMLKGWESSVPPQGEKHATGKSVKR